jgi:RNA polymerase sigma-70 factor (ECF subfamily)
MTTRPPTDLSDADLARRAGRRDEAAFRCLYDRHAGPLLAFLRARIPGEADDIHQDVWLRISNALEGFDGENFRAWAFQIARNILVDHWRRRTIKAVSLEGDGTVDSIDLPERLGDDPFAAHREALARCFGRLTPAEVQVVRARLEGVDNARIAEKAGVQVGRVYKLFHQAKAKLADCVERSR